MEEEKQITSEFLDEAKKIMGVDCSALVSILWRSIEKSKNKNDIDYIILAISECKKEEKARGQIKCPKCGGALNYTCAIDYNGHVHGKCETKNCLQWME